MAIRAIMQASMMIRPLRVRGRAEIVGEGVFAALPESVRFRRTRAEESILGGGVILGFPVGGHGAGAV